MLIVILPIFVLMILSAASQTVNIAFTTSQRSPRDVMLGSQVLRSHMVMEAVKRHSACNSTTLIYMGDPGKAQQAISQYEYKLDACIFIKWANRPIVKKCHAVGAVVVVDVIDNGHLLHDFLNIKEPASTPQNRIPRENATVYLVQSEHYAAQLNSLGLSAYSYPHQHTNTGQWGRQPVVTKPQHERLIVGFLSGSYLHIPDRLYQTILPAVCRANMTLWVINQEVPTLHVSHVRKVVSTRKVYSCEDWSRDTDTASFPSTEKNFTTTTNISSDTFGQAAFYTDEALVGVDIGLVWPAHETDDGLPNVDMLRPPTRLLHWLSRGVPTLYFPTYAYSEVAAAMNAEAARSKQTTVETGDRTYGYSANVTTAVNSTATLYKALLPLRSALVRQQLQQEGYEIAKRYSVDRIADRLIEILLDILMRRNHGVMRFYPIKVLRWFAPKKVYSWLYLPDVIMAVSLQCGSHL